MSSFSQFGAYFEQHEGLLLLLGGLSLLTFLGTLVAVPWMVVRIPRDYFTSPARLPMRWGPSHPLPRLLVLVAKNLLGGLLVLLGIAMLVLPGQGLLTVLVGILLLDFPGKYRFECWLVQRRPILRSVNWLRQRGGRPPLRFQGGASPASREIETPR